MPVLRAAPGTACLAASVWRACTSSGVPSCRAQCSSAAWLDGAGAGRCCSHRNPSCRCCRGAGRHTRPNSTAGVLRRCSLFSTRLAQPFQPNRIELPGRPQVLAFEPQLAVPHFHSHRTEPLGRGWSPGWAGHRRGRGTPAMMCSVRCTASILPARCCAGCCKTSGSGQPQPLPMLSAGTFSPFPAKHLPKWD